MLEAFKRAGEQRRGIDDPTKHRNERGDLPQLRRPHSIAIVEALSRMSGRRECHRRTSCEEVRDVEGQGGKIEPEGHVEQEERPHHSFLRRWNEATGLVTIIPK